MSRSLQTEMEDRTGQLLPMTVQTHRLQLPVRPQVQALGISREKCSSIFR